METVKILPNSVGQFEIVECWLNNKGVYCHSEGVIAVFDEKDDAIYFCETNMYEVII